MRLNRSTRGRSAATAKRGRAHGRSSFSRGRGAAEARPARPGLSLIEVLLALTILLMSMVAIGRLVDMGTDGGLETRLNVRGTRLAQAKMAEVEAGASPVEGGSGTFDTDPDWSWTVEANPEGPPGLYKVTVTVSKDNRGKRWEFALAQMVFDPAKTGSAAQAEKPTEADVEAAEAGVAPGGTSQ